MPITREGKDVYGEEDNVNIYCQHMGRSMRKSEQCSDGMRMRRTRPMQSVDGERLMIE